MNPTSKFLGVATSLLCAGNIASSIAQTKPNVIVILCDDMGYGDLSCYGSPTISTPHLDELANEGQKWTSFYSGASLSTPSRAGLLTGRYPVRSGMASRKRGVLYADSKGGLPAEEITIPELLKTNGYHTACIGKWHLGNIPQYGPAKNGFDYFYGLPYSHDMNLLDGYDYYKTAYNPQPGLFQVALMENEQIIENPVNASTLTKRYTETAIRFIEKNKTAPFFMYLAHSMPHVPLFRSSSFENTSHGGIYGDVIEELDWSVGQIVTALKKNGLDKNTLIIFTSDNGPWAWFKDHGGSAGPLRGSKSFAWEGGNRVPALFWMPGTVKPTVINDMGASFDLLPTICAITGTQLPGNTLDGASLMPTLQSGTISPRENMFYYNGDKLVACRHGKYKFHFFDTNNPDLAVNELYNLETDPGEKFNLANELPDIIQEIRTVAEAHQHSIQPVINQLELGWDPSKPGKKK